MNYKLIKASQNDINRLIEYKKKTVYEYAKDLKREEIDRINNYINDEAFKQINNYFNIIVDNEIIGCLLLTDEEDGKLLDEIYIEEKYRNKGIGTSIIKNIIEKNDVVNLWVYKENTRAISLYKKIGFKIIEETESRYYMKYSK